ncbi:MAG: response regulator [Chitinispirillaceae bacterium]|nr:response regulator [Chitinispirillaceae bacterium]
MSFETQKNFLGRTQTIIMAEIQSEKWLSWVRILIAGFYSFVAVFGVLLGRTSPAAFSIQALAVLGLFAYSGYYLYNHNNRIIQGSFLYILIFLDVTVITLIIWSYFVNNHNPYFITSAVYGAYFIAIIFTALHHKTSLSLYCGVLSVVGYSILYLIFMRDQPSPSAMINDYIVRVFLLMAVAGLGSIVSRNNSRTIQQVISSEIRYHNLVHRLSEMLFTLDSHGNFLWSNMASHTILGVPAKVLTGRSLKSFLVNPESLRLDKGGIKGTFEIYDFTGNRKFVDCVIQSVDDEGSSATFEGFVSDVTDRELAISQREEMVNRLFQYQKMESLGTLASGMAHDFNNILQNVNDTISLIQKESQEEITVHRVNLIKETMADAKFLVSELFALGRKKPLDYRSIDLVSYLEAITPQFNNFLGPNFSLTLEISDNQFWVQADTDYLKRVFQNLIGNSRDAMPEGGTITISVTPGEMDTKSTVVIIRVSDTGTGIPPELTEKIFDPFFTTKKPGKGTGLGLALVRRIVMLHNGTIFVEKTGYEGTTFRIELPLSEQDCVESDTKALLMNRIFSTVMLVDDDPKIRDVLKIFLKEFKYSVIEASNSDEAIQKLKANSDVVSIAIMDWRIGNENPHVIINNLRAIKNNLVVIVVSGYSPQQSSIEKMRIHRWFTKPYDKNQLDIEIQRILHKMQVAG